MHSLALRKRNRHPRGGFLRLPIALHISLPYVQATKHLVVGRIKRTRHEPAKRCELSGDCARKP